MGVEVYAIFRHASELRARLAPNCGVPFLGIIHLFGVDLGPRRPFIEMKPREDNRRRFSEHLQYRTIANECQNRVAEFLPWALHADP